MVETSSLGKIKWLIALSFSSVLNSIIGRHFDYFESRRLPIILKENLLL